MDLLWDVMLEPEPEPEPGEMEVARDAPRLVPSRVVIDFLRTILFLIFNTKKISWSQIPKDGQKQMKKLTEGERVGEDEDIYLYETEVVAYECCFYEMKSHKSIAIYPMQPYIVFLFKWPRMLHVKMNITKEIQINRLL